MGLADGDFHPDAVMEGSALIARKVPCTSEAMQKVLEVWERVLERKAALENDFNVRLEEPGFKLCTKGLCTLGCEKGVAISVAQVDTRRVVLAVVGFDDVTSEVLTEEAEREAGRRGFKRLKDV